MYISTKHIATYLLKETSSVDDILQLLAVCTKLIAKYGKTIVHKKYIDSIASFDNDVATLLHILGSSNKANTKSIAQISALIKVLSPNYTKQYTIKGSLDTKQFTSIDGFLYKQHTTNDSIKTEHSIQDDNISLNIMGEGKYYQRSLDTDIEKLLA